MSENQNPLKQYFRRAAIHIRLPSGGKFYKEGVLEMPPTNELPVFPMTAIDDITYKTPDALLNGSSVIDVIHSCIPSITDPWEMLSVDLNTVLAGIRIASIGNEIEITSFCPACDHEEAYTVDLHTVMEQSPDITLYDKALDIGDLKFYFQPLTYRDVNESNMIHFEEAQLQKVLKSDTITEDQKIEMLTTAFKNIAKYSVETIAKSIKCIQTPDTTVDDNAFIQEFLKEAEAELFDSVKKHLISLRDIEELKPVQIKCMECEHEYEKPFMLDMTTFFDKDS